MAASSSDCGRQAAGIHAAELGHHQRPDSAELYRQLGSPAGGHRNASLLPAKILRKKIMRCFSCKYNTRNLNKKTVWTVWHQIFRRGFALIPYMATTAVFFLQIKFRIRVYS
jgi:hypothetical protein